jgi:hypothetical protein
MRNRSRPAGLAAFSPAGYPQPAAGYDDQTQQQPPMPFAYQQQQPPPPGQGYGQPPPPPGQAYDQQPTPDQQQPQQQPQWPAADGGQPDDIAFCDFDPLCINTVALSGKLLAAPELVRFSTGTVLAKASLLLFPRHPAKPWRIQVGLLWGGGSRQPPAAGRHPAGQPRGRKALGPQGQALQESIAPAGSHQQSPSASTRPAPPPPSSVRCLPGTRWP